MAEPEPADATRLLSPAVRGDEEAANQLIPLVYGRLRALAAGYLRRERPDHTLQPTALVHEAYLRLVDQSKVDWKDRNYFLSLAAREMRRILVDHARTRNRAKRGGGWAKVILEEAVLLAEEQQIDVLDIDAALKTLSALHERQGRVVELRFFGGMTIEAVAETLGVSPETIEKDWRVARAWLHRNLKGQ